jgi:MFS family permease
MARSRLWRNADFLRLWGAETISEFGSLITHAAIPFTAILVLGASPIEIALLGIADMLPGLLVGLVAGVWVDRLPRRNILIATDLGRAVLLGTVPAAAFLGILGMAQLYAVALLTGVLTTFFDVAYRSFLPSIVDRSDLVDGNSKLSASASVAEVAGFGVAGWLVQLFSAPMAILIDALTFLVSAATIAGIRRVGERPGPGAREAFRVELRAGLRVVWGDRRLRAIAIGSALMDGSFRITGAVFLLYALDQVGFGPGVLGLIFAIGGISSLAGAVAAGPIARRLGIGRTLGASLFVAALGKAFVPLAHGRSPASAGLLAANQLTTDPGATIFEITEMSLRQAIVPEQLLGRVNATIRVIGYGAMLLGFLIGGLLGEAIGVRATLVAGVVAMALAAAWVSASPLGAIGELPGPAVAAELAVAAPSPIVEGLP